jgi:hypothetical protein
MDPSSVNRHLADGPTFQTDIFIVEFFLVTCAPIAFAASIYLNLTYATKKYPVGRSLLWLNPRWVLIIFIAFDLCTSRSGSWEFRTASSELIRPQR